MTVGVYDCRGCVFYRLVRLGVRGGLYFVVRTELRGLSVVIGFVSCMFNVKLLCAVVGYVWLRV